MKNKLLLSFLLRSGLAIVFLFAAVDATLNPTSWVGFIPLWVQAIVPGAMLLPAFSLFEALLALMLLSGRALNLTAGISSATLFFIVIINLGALDILFRDIAILFMSLALMVFARDTQDDTTP